MLAQRQLYIRFRALQFAQDTTGALLKSCIENGILLQRIMPRYLHSSLIKSSGFYERYRKAEYHDKEAEEEAEKYAKRNLYGLKTGFKEVRSEIKKWWKDEFKYNFLNDSDVFVMPGERNYVWRFNSHESLNNWYALSDYDHNQGFSRCRLSMGPTGKALFQGFVNTQVPNDGKIKNAGYCAMKCQRITKSFKRESYLDWSNYTALIMRVRGDGRSYIINISTSGYYDITWNDVYHYILFTRGGPYWQDVKIPFSKFVLSSKGRLQDKQAAIPLQRIASVGLAAGRTDGPFSLEVDFIGVELDLSLYEEDFAYEMYRVPPFVAGV